MKSNKISLVPVLWLLADSASIPELILSVFAQPVGCPSLFQQGKLDTASLKQLLKQFLLLWNKLIEMV